jgi:hypothetical protein
MTTPVTDDDLVSGVAGYLLTLSDVLAVVGETEEGTPMIFQRDMPFNMEIGAKSAIVVTSAGPWGSSNDHNTAEFERLGIQIWTGPIRAEDDSIVEDAETYRRGKAVWRIVDRHLHRVRGGHVWWGSIRSVTSRRFGGYDDYAVPDGNGVVIGTHIYGVEIG